MASGSGAATRWQRPLPSTQDDVDDYQRGIGERLLRYAIGCSKTRWDGGPKSPRSGKKHGCRSARDADQRVKQCGPPELPRPLQQ
jgi:hypothetical protein